MKNKENLVDEYYCEYKDVCHQLYCKLVKWCKTKQIYPNKLYRDVDFLGTLKEVNKEYKASIIRCKIGNGRWDMWSYPDRWNRFFNNMIEWGWLTKEKDKNGNIYFKFNSVKSLKK